LWLISSERRAWVFEFGRTPSNSVREESSSPCPIGYEPPWATFDEHF
jgi:hypothetical protein